MSTYHVQLYQHHFGQYHLMRIEIPPSLHSNVLPGHFVVQTILAVLKNEGLIHCKLTFHNEKNINYKLDEKRRSLLPFSFSCD